MTVKLTTKRLKLRQFTPDDREFVYELMNSPGWLEFIGDRNIDSLEAAENYIVERFYPTYEQAGCGFWCVLDRTSEQALGTVSMILRDNLDEIDLGFAFLPEHTGKGFAYEASTAILELEKMESGLNSVLAFTDLQNKQSRKLLEKLGFSELGLKVVKPEWGESLLYRLILN